MPTNYKTLGQVAPSAASDTTLYTVPSATQAVLSTISICNRVATAATYRVAVRPDGAAIANQHYVVFDAPIGGNQTVALTLGVAMDAADVLTVRASTASVSFSVFGSEIT